jgi:predicted nucleic acid-binding protein
MKPKIYIETTIPSYLTARPSRDLIRAAHQEITREWWEDRRSAFELFVSQAVIQEAGAGDPTAAAERLALLTDLPVLVIATEVESFGQELLHRLPLPLKAAVDALHISYAAVYGMDYLLTWNCKHIANATLRKRIITVCESSGYTPPLICTPEELLEP